MAKTVETLFVASMAARFPGGELYFDAESQMAVNSSNKMVQKSRNVGAMMYFSIDNAKVLEQRAPRIHLLSADPKFKGIKPSMQ